MSQENAPVDLIISKLMALEVVLMTLIRPAAGNPAFWSNVEQITQAAESVAQPDEVFQRRWATARRYIEEWRQAMMPPA